MTIDNNVTNIIGLTISCLIIWVLIFKLYRDYRLEAFRDAMFALRDRMFDEAADGNLDFDSPAYKLLRRTMNGFLRYGHNLNVATIILMCRSYSNGRRHVGESLFEKIWQEALQQVTPQERQKLTNYYDMMNATVVRHMVVCSPEALGLLVLFWIPILAFWLIARGLAFYGTCVQWWKRTKKVLKDNTFPEMDNLAYEQGA
jgi:hypothetical protein